MTEHPLARLLAEGQFQVYTVLQPLVTAIEKAGGLPKLEIRLDNCSLDRKPFEGEQYLELIAFEFHVYVHMLRT